MNENARVQAEAVVQETLPRALYRVSIVSNPRHRVLAQASGRTRRLRVGERVTVEIDPHDATRGQIVHRGIKTSG